MIGVDRVGEHVTVQYTVNDSGRYIVDVFISDKEEPIKSVVLDDEIQYNKFIISLEEKV